MMKPQGQPQPLRQYTHQLHLRSQHRARASSRVQHHQHKQCLCLSQLLDNDTLLYSILSFLNQEDRSRLMHRTCKHFYHFSETDDYKRFECSYLFPSSVLRAFHPHFLAFEVGNDDGPAVAEADEDNYSSVISPCVGQSQRKAETENEDDNNNNVSKLEPRHFPNRKVATLAATLECGPYAPLLEFEVGQQAHLFDFTRHQGALNFVRTYNRYPVRQAIQYFHYQQQQQQQQLANNQQHHDTTAAGGAYGSADTIVRRFLGAGKLLFLVEPTRDTFTDHSLPPLNGSSANNNSDQLLKVDCTRNDEQKTYITFEFESYLRGDSDGRHKNIQAFLVMYPLMISSTPRGLVDDYLVEMVESSWDERAISFVNNEPHCLLGAPAKETFCIDPQGVGRLKSIDITTFITYALRENLGRVDLRLTGNRDGCKCIFGSRENANPHHRPVLLLVVDI